MRRPCCTARATSVDAFVSPPHAHPWDGWSYAATHRVQELPTGGTLVMINGHCAIVFAPFPVIGCALGKINSKGGLFEHMNDPSGQRPGSLP